MIDGESERKAFERVPEEELPEALRQIEADLATACQEAH